MGRKLENGDVVEDKADSLFRESVIRKLVSYMGVSEEHPKKDLKKMLLSNPGLFLEKLRSINEPDPQVKGGILQVIFSMVSNYLFKRVWDLCKKNGMDFMNVVSSASRSMIVDSDSKPSQVDLPADLKVYYEILVELSKYEMKTREFYRPRNELQFIVPKLHIEKTDSGNYFVLNPNNGRWAIVDDVSPLDYRLYMRRIGLADLVVGDLLVLPEHFLNRNERDYLEKLVKVSVIYTNKRTPKFGSPSLRIYPTLLSIIITTGCNFRCKYCYEGDFPRIQPNLDHIDNRINELFSRYSSIKTVGFFGGEPLLEFEGIRRIVMNPFVYRSKKILQTNGSLITPEIARYLKIHSFSVGVSLDGPEEFNSLRIDSTGKNSYYKVLDGIDNLRRVKLKYSILTTYTSNSRGLENEYLSWIKSLGAKSFSVNIGVHRRYLPDWRDLLAFFKSTFDEYVHSDVWMNSRYATFLYYLDALILPPEKRSLMMFRNPCGAGRSHLAISPDGGISPCPELLVFRSNKVNFYDDFKPVYERVVERTCPECPFRYICTGACPGKSLLYNGNINEPIRELCNFYKRFFVWLADRLHEDSKYLEVYKKWKRGMRGDHIILVR